jgi:hypothetical protein
MPQQLPELEKSCQIYARLMEEIKRRQAVITQVLSQTIPMPRMAAFEFCYLQLRKICEVFALGCLAAHGDIPEVRSKLLQKNVQCRPNHETTEPHTLRVLSSAQQADSRSGHPKTKRGYAITTGFLTKDELLALYGECGNYLHRGTIRQLVGKWEPTLDFEKIALWSSKIITLLNHHQIQTSQPDKQIWVLMQAEDGNVHWSIMEKLAADDPRVPR